MRDYTLETISQALLRIGDGPLSALSVDLPVVDAAKSMFPQVVDEATSIWEWSFARARQALTATNTPADGEDYLYDLPADLIALRSIYPDVPYTIEGRVLMLASDEVTIRYIRSIVEFDGVTGDPEFSVSPLPPSFLSAVSCRLGAELAGQFAGNMQLAAMLQQEYMALLQAAIGPDSMQLPGDSTPPVWWHEVV